MDPLQQKIYTIAFTFFLLGFMVWMFLLRNFTISWLKVRFSGGKKVLVKVVSILGDYFVAGQYDKQHVQFIGRSRRDNPKPGRLVYVAQEKESFYNCFSVRCIDIDDAKDLVYMRFDASYSKVPPINTEYYDELVKTALAKPSEEGIGLFNAKTWQIIVLLSIIILGVLATMVYVDVKKTAERVVLLHEEHIQIGYEVNQTKAEVSKLKSTGLINSGISGG